MIRGTTYRRSVMGAEEFVIGLPSRQNTVQTHQCANYERVLVSNTAGLAKPIIEASKNWRGH